MTFAGRVVRDPVTMPPDGITQTQSYAWVLREVFLYWAMQLPFFVNGNFTYRRNRRQRIEVADLPILGIYIDDEIMTPDGDANEGVIKFIHTVLYGFSVMVSNNDEADAEQKLDAGFWALMNGLWRDPAITNLLHPRNYHTGTSSPDNVRFEGIVRGTREHVFGNLPQTQESSYAEMQYVASVQFRTDFGANVTDDLNTIAVTTSYPNLSAIYDLTLQRMNGATNGNGTAISSADDAAAASEESAP